MIERDLVLIITNRADTTSDFVVRELNARGIPFFRLNTDEFPLNAIGSFHIGDAGEIACSYRLLDRDRVLDFARVRSIWYRRPVPPIVNSSVLSFGEQRFAQDEAYHFLRGLWHSLDALWVSYPPAIWRAEYKLYQLKVAQQLGFQIPDTVVTNDPDVARAFLNKPRRVIAKPVHVGFIDDDPSRFVYTTELSPDDLPSLEALRLAPVILQELVVEKLDIRVTVVGDRVFAAEIEPERLPANLPDWRAQSIDQLAHRVHDLPTRIEALCVKLVRSLGLRFGAIDLVLSKGIYWFLEINPNGQWAWIEIAVGHPISAALVDLLITKETDSS